MPNESTNLKLKLYDPDVDANVLVYDFLKDIAGYTSSNFVKIDTSINTLHDSIIGTDGNVVFYNKQEVFLAVHPVGSIFLSTDGTEPAGLYGGTWEQIKDVFLLGAGDTYPAESTGGNTIHTHELDKLVAAIYPAGLYFDYRYVNSDLWESNYANSIPNGEAPPKQGTYNSGIEVVGKPTKASSNMPPYYSIYIWRRIE